MKRSITTRKSSNAGGLNAKRGLPAVIEKNGRELSEARELAESKSETRKDSESHIEQSEGAVSMEVLNRSVRLVSDVFQLDESYSVVGFSDKGNTVKVSMENHEYSVVIEVKNKSAHGLDAQ